MLNVERRSVSVLHLSPAEMADFVATDVQLLREEFQVKTFFCENRLRGLPDAFRILKAVASTDVNVSWFGYSQAYFAVLFSRMLGKPSIVILGGFDVSSDEWPDHMIPRTHEKRLREVLRHATLLLPISRRIAELASRFTDRPDIRTVPLGFDSQEFAPQGMKDGSVATIGYIRRDYLERKGLLDFTLAARELEETRFFLIGKPLDDSVAQLRQVAGPNVVLTGWLNRDDLIARLGRASVYVQASTHEGFGSALAQAMLCECVPVVSDKGALPEVVGDTGIYVTAGKPHNVAEGIRRALESPELGQRARARIVNKFDLDRRRKALLATINEVLG